MFGLKKKKATIKELDNYIIELSEEKVLIYTKMPLWRVEYTAQTTPYALFASMWDDEETLSVLCLFIQTNLSMVSDAEYVAEVMKKAMDHVASKSVAPKVSKSEDDAILREAQVLHEQTEEAVSKHIEATEPKKRKRNDRTGSKKANR